MVDIKLEMGLFSKQYYSFNHIKNSFAMAKACKQIEDQFEKDGLNNGLPIQNVDLAMLGVISSCAFLEAIINETFLDCKESKSEIPSKLKQIRKEQLGLIANVWEKANVDRLSILEKYQVFLALTGREFLDEGAEPWQSTKTLIEIRNFLIHAKSESVLVAKTEDFKHNDSKKSFSEKIQEKCRGKFQENKVFSFTANEFFPHKCLGYGCSIWATETVINFTDLFFKKLGHISFETEIKQFIKWESL